MSALQLGRIWASAPLSPNIDPGATKYNLGWVAEIPVFQMLNYINNRYDTNIVSLAQRGMFEWGSDIDYKNSALVWDEADGFIYVSKLASPNTSTRPGLNAAQWDKSAVQISRKQYDDAVLAWNNHIANTSNPHALTTEILDTYTKAVIDSKVSTNNSNINTHIANKSNPHAVTAIQAGAVPVTGGNYTGLVRHLFASTGIGASALACSLLADATGAFLAKGANAKLGIDNLFKPVFINDAAVKSQLLLDSNYIAAREAVEASYVVPTPDCQVDFRNGLGMLYGAGAVTFSGPAGTRGYTTKSGTAATAGLNEPRLTPQGLYVNGVADTETLMIPTTGNIQGATSYSYCAYLSMPIVSDGEVLLQLPAASSTTGLLVWSGNLVYRSVVGGVITDFPVMVMNTALHKLTVVSDAVANKTYVYVDGALKLTVNSKQDAISSGWIGFTAPNAGSSGRYLQSFRTWLYALTPQQVSNL